MIEVTVSFTQKELMQAGYLPYSNLLMFKYQGKKLSLYYKNQEGLFEELNNIHVGYIVLDKIVRGEC